MAYIITNWQNITWSVGVLAAAIVVALLTHRALFSAMDRISKRSGAVVYESLIRWSRRPARWIIPAIAALSVVPGLPISAEAGADLAHALGLAIIAGMAWLAVSFTRVLEDVIASRYRLDEADNLAARRVQTQVRVLRRIGTVIIVIVAAAAMLMTFPTARTIGAGMFASAGAAGLIVGLAARPTISSMIAGVQIALTEPIRLDDVVVVEGEWGRIEEIHTTFVVVRIWDQRRLVVPLSYFIEKPFQNWTHSSADITGSVFLHVDYTVPVDEVRSELRRVVESSSLWDGKVCSLQVTNLSERTLELRALMSSANSSNSWDLRCLVRERLIAFLQQQYPETLPKFRTQMTAPEPRAQTA